MTLFMEKVVMIPLKVEKGLILFMVGMVMILSGILVTQLFMVELVMTSFIETTMILILTELMD